MHPLDEILDMLAGATNFADTIIGKQPGMQVQTGFFVGMYLSNKHPEYASALFPAIQQKLGPTEAMFSTMVDMWVERLPIDSN